MRLPQGGLSEEDTFNVLFEEFKDMVYSLAYHMTGSREDAQDITQEVFINVYRGLKGFKGQSSPKTWIYRITMNTIRAYYRKKRFKSIVYLFSDRGDRSVETELTKDNDPELQLHQIEFMRVLRSVLKKLTFHQRAVFVMKHIKGMKLKEISEVLQCSEGTVKSHLFRAVKVLKKGLKEAGYEM
ncbi:MAG: sigma-70 family RNA polymerase sigma factor [Nitrospirae bacterium]|nr:MAG: sigma-70 family RNA polymerase sigma factor [Nitrospirota bacterium]